MTVNMLPAAPKIETSTTPAYHCEACGFEHKKTEGQLYYKKHLSHARGGRVYLAEIKVPVWSLGQ